MLVLTRREKDTIVIGDPMKPIAVISIVMVERGGKVMLGVVSPREVPVHRGEIALRILKDKQEGGAK